MKTITSLLSAHENHTDHRPKTWRIPLLASFVTLIVFSLIPISSKWPLKFSRRCLIHSRSGKELCIISAILDIKKTGCDSGTMFLNTQPACTVAGLRQPTTSYPTRPTLLELLKNHNACRLALRSPSVILPSLNKTHVTVVLNKSPQRSHHECLFRSRRKVQQKNFRTLPGPFAHAQGNAQSTDNLPPVVLTPLRAARQGASCLCADKSFSTVTRIIQRSGLPPPLPGY